MLEGEEERKDPDCRFWKDDRFDLEAIEMSQKEESISDLAGDMLQGEEDPDDFL